MAQRQGKQTGPAHVEDGLHIHTLPWWQAGGVAVLIAFGLRVLVLFTVGAVTLWIRNDMRWLALGLLAFSFGFLLDSPRLVSWLNHGRRIPERVESVAQIADAAEQLATEAKRLEELLVLDTVRRLEADPAARASIERFEADVQKGVRRPFDSLEDRIKRWGS